MISFFELSWKIRSLIAVIILILEIINIFNIVIALRAKRYKFAVLAVLLFAISYIFEELVIQTIVMHLAKTTLNSTILPVFAPALVVFLSTMFLTVITVFMFVYNLWDVSTHFTQTVIKDYADEMEVGICYYMDGGRVVFQNKEMDILCQKIIGKMLLNGEELYEALKDRIVTLSDGTTRKFEHKLTTIDGVRVHELIAFDITEFVEKTRELEKENKELSEFNKKMREFNIALDDTVRREEILQAKIDIHDEMNQLLLSTTAFVDNRDFDKTQDILDQWKKNTILLKFDKDSNEGKLLEIQKLAKSLYLKLEFEEDVLFKDKFDGLNDEYKDIFCLAAKEAMVNAVKHAEANIFKMSINKTADSLKFVFANDGRLPSGKIARVGGLSNLEKVVIDAMGIMEIEIDKYFNLILTF